MLASSSKSKNSVIQAISYSFKRADCNIDCNIKTITIAEQYDKLLPLNFEYYSRD